LKKVSHTAGIEQTDPKAKQRMAPTRKAVSNESGGANIVRASYARTDVAALVQLDVQFSATSPLRCAALRFAFMFFSVLYKTYKYVTNRKRWIRRGYV
jgi:hypothetical protein